MVSIDMCKHKAGYRLYHKTNAFADLESWGCALHNDYLHLPFRRYIALDADTALNNNLTN